MALTVITSNLRPPGGLGESWAAVRQFSKVLLRYVKREFYYSGEEINA